MAEQENWSQWKRSRVSSDGQTATLWLPPSEPFDSWRDWLLPRCQLPAEQHGGTSLQTGRNVVSRHEYEGRQIVLKDFGLRHAQPLIYALRSSKARRAAHAACLLSANNIASPRALAVLEHYRGGMLKRAFLVCEEIPGCITLRAGLNDGSLDHDLIIPKLGRLVARLHEAALWHADLTAANVLVDTNQSLWLIDINRLRQRQLAAARRLQNIAKLSLPDELWPLFLSHYDPQEQLGTRSAQAERLTRLHQAFRERGRRKQLRKARREEHR